MHDLVTLELLNELFEEKLNRESAQGEAEFETFVECSDCRRKPGSPILCEDCLRRRDAFKADTER
jgi:hypothetical protein